MITTAPHRAKRKDQLELGIGGRWRSQRSANGKRLTGVRPEKFVVQVLDLTFERDDLGAASVLVQTLHDAAVAQRLVLGLQVLDLVQHVRQLRLQLVALARQQRLVLVGRVELRQQRLQIKKFDQYDKYDFAVSGARLLP